MRNPFMSMLPQRIRRHPPSALLPFRDIENEMGRWLFQSPFSLNWPGEYEDFDFAPACNMTENGKEYTLQFDVPGIKKEDIKIELENNRLTVSGERRQKKEESDEKHFRSEVGYGSFMRSFTLPTAVDENKIDAQQENGVLTVKIPKATTTKAKEVKVH